MAFWQQLVSPDEAAVDSIIVGGIVALLSLIAFTGWQVYHDPAAFNAMSFGAGVGAVLGAVGAGKRLRDGVGQDVSH